MVVIEGVVGIVIIRGVGGMERTGGVVFVVLVLTGGGRRGVGRSNGRVDRPVVEVVVVVVVVLLLLLLPWKLRCVHASLDPSLINLGFRPL